MEKLKYPHVEDYLEGTKMVARTPEEQQRIKEILEKEGLEEFFEEVAYAHDHEKALERVIKTKHALKRIIEKYEKEGQKIAFEKADNRNSIVAITFRTDEDHEMLSQLAIEMEDIRNGAEPKALELSYEEFATRFKPRMIWYKGRGASKKATYSSLMGGYRFARNYKVVILPVRFIDEEDIQIMSKISKNIYPYSYGDRDELLPRGFIIFIPS